MSKTLKKSILLIILALGILFLGGTAVNAATMSDEFKSHLNKDGVFEINAAIPKSEEDFGNVVETITNDEDGNWLGIGFENVSEDFSEADFIINKFEENEEKHRVKLKWNYDENVNKIINSYLNSALKGKTEFKVSDLELVSYWINNTGKPSDVLSLYSGELKELLDYKNIQLYADGRAGSDDKFTTSNMGFGSFKNDGVTYKIIPNLGATAQHIIYIDENVGNEELDIITAVQKRIDDYFGKEKVNIIYGGDNILALYTDEINANISRIQLELDEVNEKITVAENSQNQNEIATLTLEKMSLESELEQENNYLQYFQNSFNNADGEHNFLNDALNGWYFIAEVASGDAVGMYHFIVQKDSSKMVTPIVKTADVATNVEISTTENLPLDTTIQAKELTEGTEYEKIVKLLNVTDNKTFDLKLYSDSLGEYITKLDNGKFEVKIPIPEDFKGKDLMVYYVDKNNEVHEYEVTPEGDYAVYTTDHFSIYTLAVEGGIETGNENGNSTGTGNGDDIGTGTNTNKGDKDETPPTGVESYISYVLVATIIAGAGIVTLKKKI